MRSIILAGGALLLVGTGNAMAQCTSVMSMPALGTLLANNTACVGTTPNAEWSEWHSGSTTSGTVVDWKKGPSDPVDPTTNVGTYQVTAYGMSGGKVTYTYGTNSYTYVVQTGSGSPYTFCPVGGGTNLSVTIKSGQGPC